MRFHRDAVADLDAIEQADPDDHARLIVFMEEYLTDTSFVHSLAIDGFSNEVVNGVRRLDQWRRRGFDVWRIKIMGMDTRLGRRKRFLNYRFVYAFDDINQVIWFLGIFHRSEFDYDPDEPNGLRVAAAYRDCGLPTITLH